MDRGTYAAASGGLLSLAKLHVVNNNLANANTPGFKRQYLIREQQAFEDTLTSKLQESMPFAKGDHDRTPGVVQVRTATDFSVGSIKNTGRNLDVALENPNDFFVVNTPQGLMYTRAGNFSVDSEGQLVTTDGHPVQGDGGPIVLDGANSYISSGGVVMSGGNEVGRLLVTRHEDPAALERVGSNRYRALPGTAAPVPQESPSIVPNALEMSNVSAIQSVIELISATRGFELYTKAAGSIDQMNEQAISRVGSST
ncbi:MAG: flagellar hook-basal body protein [Bdellovibrionales bacterium]|nr:flagellar hook-basal body protein [Bdellovibrionales bacterium]